MAGPRPAPPPCALRGSSSRKGYSGDWQPTSGEYGLGVRSVSLSAPLSNRSPNQKEATGHRQGRLPPVRSTKPTKPASANPGPAPSGARAPPEERPVLCTEPPDEGTEEGARPLPERVSRNRDRHPRLDATGSACRPSRREPPVQGLIVVPRRCLPAAAGERPIGAATHPGGG